MPQHLPEIVRHHSKSGGCGQEVRHWPPIVHKETNEAARLCQRERVTEQAIYEVLLAGGLSGLSEQSGCAGHIFLGQFQAGKQYLTEHEAVNRSIILPHELEALSPMRESGVQVVPCVADTGQGQMRFAGQR